LAVLAVTACSYAAFSAPVGADYPGPACKGCDFAGPPIDALASGHLTRFFDTQPFMGPFTLLLRAPVVAVARLAGGGELSQYRLGALICLLLAAALSGLLLAGMPPRRWQWLLRALLLVLILAGPLTLKTLWWGHPEEVVGGLLCACAVLFASRGKPLLAGVLLGLAIATKQWALLAILPVLVVCERDRRMRLLAVAAGAAALLIVPMLIGDPSLFLSQNLSAGLALSGAKTAGVTPTNIWFAYGRELGMMVGAGSGAGYGIPASLSAITHPLALAVGLALPLLFWRRFPRPTAADALMLLALVFLMRCLLDPLTVSYHHAPFFVAIAASEGLRRRGLPVVTVVSAAALWAIAHWVAPAQDAALLNETYLAWALPVAGYLAFRCFLPNAQLRRRPSTERADFARESGRAATTTA
jgi:Glycosyltransferase family 87